MKSADIRKHFFSYFARLGHEQVASSSLIPAQDPTILFTNAGMNQFKDIFLGNETRSYKSAVSIQKCVRAGGKHNDLDNVGFTKRHLTFFEMMGNFSFGSYFKKEAIVYAWEFLTKELRIPTEHLHATVFETDDESYNLWISLIGLPPEKVHRCGAQENFWQMGETGPCGPCSEIHLDRGLEFGCKDMSTCGPACECDRFLEIWNLVFMEFERQSDGTLRPLTKKGVDTGMGLERLCAVMQDKDSVFMTDLFEPIIAKIETLTGHRYIHQSPLLKGAFHVLADHIRSSTLLIADGCSPSNEGRGYVLRKIIRRAALFGHKLSSDNFFPQLSVTVIQEMGTVYPEIVVQKSLILSVLTAEIDKFSANLSRGNVILAQYLELASSTKTITGKQTFKLYDTYGFPPELVLAAAREKGYTVDQEDFEAEMVKQQAQSGKKTVDALSDLDIHVQTEFTGYNELKTESPIMALVQNNQIVAEVAQGQQCYVITKQSPFFIVGGGQVPDQGCLVINGYTAPLISVRYIGTAIAAEIIAPLTIHTGMSVTAIVDTQWRTSAMKNHTATHLLQSALITLLGKHVKQSGSLVHPDYLRFDFTHHENLPTTDIEAIEVLVNQKILENIPVEIIDTSLKDALDRGALAFFGDKYKPEAVRLVTIDEFSKELCGGTHVTSTGMIGVFKIIESIALAAGHRRILAVTGNAALSLFQETFSITKTLSQTYKVKREEVITAVHKQKEACHQLSTTVKQMTQKLWHMHIPLWQKNNEIIRGVPFLAVHIAHILPEELKNIALQLNQDRPGFYFIFSTDSNEHVSFFATIDTKYLSLVDHKKFIVWLKEKCGLRGGGSAQAMQGGGVTTTDNLDSLLKEWLNDQ